VFAQIRKGSDHGAIYHGPHRQDKGRVLSRGAYAPIGYKYENGLLVIDPYKAQMVKDIFDMFLSGHSINHIWTVMKDRHQGKWSAAKISLILRNNVYIGKVKFKGMSYDGIHEPIVSQEVYEAANRLLTSSERKASHTTAQKTPFRANTLLSGLLFCERCGARYSGAHGYYKCYSRSKTSKKFIVDPECKNDNWQITNLDDIIIDEIFKISKREDLLYEVLKSKKPTMATNTESIKNRMADIEAQIEKLIDLYQVSGLPMDKLTARISELKAEQTALESQLQDNSSNGQTFEVFLSSIKRFNDSFATAEIEEKRLMVSSLIERVTLNGKTVKITWRL